MSHEWSLDLAIAPDGALSRISSAINRPKKRALGLFKMHNEFVGLVHGDEFEIWERRGRAIRGVGSVKAIAGGSRVEARFRLSPLARVLLPLFGLLYAVGTVGAAERDAILSPSDLAVALSGALLLVAIFVLAARRQRADLEAFLERVLGDTPRDDAR